MFKRNVERETEDYKKIYDAADMEYEKRILGVTALLQACLRRVSSQ